MQYFNKKVSAFVLATSSLNLSNSSIAQEDRFNTLKDNLLPQRTLSVTEPNPFTYAQFTNDALGQSSSNSSENQFENSLEQETFNATSDSSNNINSDIEPGTETPSLWLTLALMGVTVGTYIFITVVVKPLLEKKMLFSSADDFITKPPKETLARLGFSKSKKNKNQEIPSKVDLGLVRGLLKTSVIKLDQLRESGATTQKLENLRSLIKGIEKWLELSGVKAVDPIEYVKSEKRREIEELSLTIAELEPTSQTYEKRFVTAVEEGIKNALDQIDLNARQSLVELNTRAEELKEFEIVLNQKEEDISQQSVQIESKLRELQRRESNAEEKWSESISNLNQSVKLNEQLDEKEKVLEQKMKNLNSLKDDLSVLAEFGVEEYVKQIKRGTLESHSTSIEFVLKLLEAENLLVNDEVVQ